MSSQTIKAGRQHFCWSCNGLIAKGAPCLRTIEGGYTVWRHLDCAARLRNARGELVHDCPDLRAHIAKADSSPAASGSFP